jgi:hypothetical protein
VACLQEFVGTQPPSTDPSVEDCITVFGDFEPGTEGCPVTDEDSESLGSGFTALVSVVQEAGTEVRKVNGALVVYTDSGQITVRSRPYLRGANGTYELKRTGVSIGATYTSAEGGAIDDGVLETCEYADLTFTDGYFQCTFDVQSTFAGNGYIIRTYYDVNGEDRRQSSLFAPKDLLLKANADGNGEPTQDALKIADQMDNYVPLPDSEGGEICTAYSETKNPCGSYPFTPVYVFNADSGLSNGGLEGPFITEPDITTEPGEREEVYFSTRAFNGSWHSHYRLGNVAVPGAGVDGSQAVSLFPIGETSTPWSVLGNITVEATPDTFLGDVDGVSFEHRTAVKDQDTDNKAGFENIYLSLDSNNDGERDACLISAEGYGLYKINNSGEWHTTKFGLNDKFKYARYDCSNVGDVESLSFIQSKHSTDRVLSVSIQVIAKDTEFRPVAHLYVDDIQLDLRQ